MPDANSVKRYLQTQLDELDELEHALTMKMMSRQYLDEWKAKFDGWDERTRAILRRCYGPQSRELKSFSDVYYGTWSGHGPDKDDYLRRIPQWRAQLTTSIWELDKFGGVTPEATTTAQDALPKIFIAHSGESSALNRLIRFLRALKVEPQIAEWLPYAGAQVPDHVRSVYSDCAGAIIFAEASEAAPAKPGPGVLIEVGLLQAHFQNRIVYLREEGTTTGAMADSFAAAFFTPDNLEQAFYRVVVELKSWGVT